MRTNTARTVDARDSREALAVLLFLFALVAFHAVLRRRIDWFDWSLLVATACQTALHFVPGFAWRRQAQIIRVAALASAFYFLAESFLRGP
jgi:hypothetical protein